MQPLHLLLVEDNALDAELTLAQLERADYAVEAQVVYNEADFVAQIEARRFDVILADFVMPSFSGIEALTIADERAPDTPFIFVSGLLGEEHAVEMLKRGATDYVLKQRLQRLPAVVRRALRESTERQQRIAVERVLRETETHFRAAHRCAQGLRRHHARSGRAHPHLERGLGAHPGVSGAGCGRPVGERVPEPGRPRRRRVRGRTRNGPA